VRSELGELLRGVRDQTLDVSTFTIGKVAQYHSLIQFIGKDGAPLVYNAVPYTGDVVGYRLTRRGEGVLKDSERSEADRLPFDKADPPLTIRLWLSAFRRWLRNCPKGLHLAYSDGQLHILTADLDGKVANDDAHRLMSMRAPWVE
jgi:hypothetical protein